MGKNFLTFLLFIVFIYCLALRIDTMDVDASQYAEISREMMNSGDYLHLFDRGKDYLDKPPFLFWASATSMKIFGVSNFGYKLPSLLFAIWALFATYKLAKRLYDEITAKNSVIVLATCQGMFLMTNDIRCDTILMSWVITAIWLINEWVITRKMIYILLGSASIAFGMMTKGPIALLVPIFCFTSNWALKRQWKNFLQPVYLLALGLIALLLVPMSIGLYQQYDMHPEKGVSGLRFFYWSQSFGRITGENKWKNEVDITFLLQNMFWTFLPWIFLFLPALFMNCKELILHKMKLKPQQEWITSGGFIFSYFSLGLSAYQLPHYIFVVFPLVAIITGNFIVKLSSKSHQKTNNFFKYFYFVIITLLLISVMLLNIYSFNYVHYYYIYYYFIVLIIMFIVYSYVQIFRKKMGIVAFIAWGMIIINLFLSGLIYPKLLKYQVGGIVGRFINRNNIPIRQVFSFKMQDPLNALPFYANGIVGMKDSIGSIQPNNYLLLMNSGLDSLHKHGITYTPLYHGYLFKVSELTFEFLNPKTRKNALKDYYFIKIKTI